MSEQSWEFDLGMLANDGVVWEGNFLTLCSQLPSSVTGDVHHKQTPILLSERQFFLCFVKQLVLSAMHHSKRKYPLI